MQIMLHGGKCCGIKHIYDVSEHPDYETSSQAASERLDPLNVERGMSTNGEGKNIWSEKRPAETYGKRFAAAIEFINNTRKQVHLPQAGQLIQVVIPQSNKQYWEPIYKHFGFELVTQFQNSNSGANLCVYHLVTKNDVDYIKSYKEYLAARQPKVAKVDPFKGE